MLIFRNWDFRQVASFSSCSWESFLTLLKWMELGRLIKSLWKSRWFLNTVWFPVEFLLISMELGRNSLYLHTFLLTIRLLNTDYSSKINSNVQHFFHNWKTNMWSSDCINTHSAIRKVSKREMKNGTWRDEWKQEENAIQLSSPENDPKEQLRSILKCEKTASMFVWRLLSFCPSHV